MPDACGFAQQALRKSNTHAHSHMHTSARLPLPCVPVAMAPASCWSEMEPRVARLSPCSSRWLRGSQNEQQSATYDAAVEWRRPMRLREPACLPVEFVQRSSCQCRHQAALAVDSDHAAHLRHVHHVVPGHSTIVGRVAAAHGAHAVMRFERRLENALRRGREPSERLRTAQPACIESELHTCTSATVVGLCSARGRTT